jgi:hypothetical protein
MLSQVEINLDAQDRTTNHKRLHNHSHLHDHHTRKQPCNHHNTRAAAWTSPNTNGEPHVRTPFFGVPGSLPVNLLKLLMFKKSLFFRFSRKWNRPSPGHHFFSTTSLCMKPLSAYTNKAPPTTPHRNINQHGEALQRAGTA